LVAAPWKLQNKLNFALAIACSGGVLITRSVAIAGFCIMALCAPGCSFFHHGEPQQQKFMDALNRGNGAEASQLWLTMSATDRANLAHSVGFRPQVDRADIGRGLLKHQQEEAAKDGQDPDEDSDEDSDTMGDAVNGSETDSQQIEVPGDARAGSLANLPVDLPTGIPVTNTPLQAPPITEIGPQ
jgi:hypothetical protein